MSLAVDALEDFNRIIPVFRRFVEEVNYCAIHEPDLFRFMASLAEGEAWALAEGVMATPTDDLDHAAYKGLTRLPEVLRRFDYARSAMTATAFVDSLDFDDVIELADTDVVGRPGSLMTNVRRAALYMWDHMPSKERYALADELHVAALARMRTQV
jgi:hypothetical protein